MSAQYKIILSNNAKAGLNAVPNIYFDKIISEIQNLTDYPRPYGYKKLANQEAYRLRSGNYRIIYEIDDEMLIISIITIAHRKDVYKK